MDEITQGLISVMKRELPRHPPTFDNLYEYFISRSRKNLHVVLCFSPVSFYFIDFCVGGVTSLNVLGSWNVLLLMRWFVRNEHLLHWIKINSLLTPIFTDQNLMPKCENLKYSSYQWLLPSLQLSLPRDRDYLICKRFGDVVLFSSTSSKDIPSRMSLT